MNNTGERVITLEDGQRVTDPWVLLDNWIAKEGLQEAFEDDPLEIVAAYAQDRDGAAQTLENGL